MGQNLFYTAVSNFLNVEYIYDDLHIEYIIYVSRKYIPLYVMMELEQGVTIMANLITQPESHLKLVGSFKA